MKIAGFTKLTMVDYPGKLAAVIFIAGCNMRCPFCHNKDLVINPGLVPGVDEEEIFSYLEKRKNILEGVVITGGEPTLYKDLENLITRIKKLGLAVKLDTNGSKPEVIEKLIYKKLVDYIAMDIKNSFTKYKLTIGRSEFNLNNIDKSISILKKGAVDYEFRTTVVDELHEEDDFKEIAKMLKGAKRYYLQSYRESDGVINKKFSPPSEEKLNRCLDIVKKEIANAKIRKYL